MKKINLFIIFMLCLTSFNIVFAEEVNILETEESVLEETEILNNIENVLKEPIKDDTSEDTTTSPAIDIEELEKNKPIIYIDRVYNIENQKGIEGVEVLLINMSTSEEFSTITDEEGNFTIEVYPGEYNLSLYKEGFKPLIIYITITNEGGIIYEI